MEYDPSGCRSDIISSVITYWKSSASLKISKRNQMNRGVKFDEAGKPLPAKPTHTGGAKSILEMGDSLDAYIETKQKGKRKLTESSSLTGDIEAAEEEVASAQDSPEVEWIDEGYRVIVEEYNKNLDELFGNKPQDHPSNSDRRNPVAWAKAVGGPNRGNIRGVSNEADLRLLGYPTSKRQAHHVTNSKKIMEERERR